MLDPYLRRSSASITAAWSGITTSIKKLHSNCSTFILFVGFWLSFVIPKLLSSYHYDWHYLKNHNGWLPSFCFYFFSITTLPKFNITPEKWWLENCNFPFGSRHVGPGRAVKPSLRTMHHPPPNHPPRPWPSVLSWSDLNGFSAAFHTPPKGEKRLGVIYDHQVPNHQTLTKIFRNEYQQFGCFQKEGYPQIINSNRVFPHKPSILGYTHFWKHPLVAVRTIPKKHPLANFACPQKIGKPESLPD